MNIGDNKITEKSRIKVYWDDKPENYSTEGKNRIKAHFSNQYGVPKTRINVVFRPVKSGDNEDLISIEDATVDNIMDVQYQRELYKEWIKREEKDVDFDRLMKLDDQVNAALNLEDVETKHRKWEIKKLLIDNFLCYGDDNNVDFTKLMGFNVVTSSPANQGGKSTFIVDAIKFLLYGVTSKTDKNEEVFNMFRDKDSVKLEGHIETENGLFAIERTLTRKLKKAGGYNVKNSVSYYEILPNGEKVIMEGEHAIQTTKLLEDVIGPKNDFEMVIMATGSNLEDLIETKPTERGKLLTRFIGLEIIEKKEITAKKLYSDFSKTMKSNVYNLIDLNSEIEQLNDTIKESELTIKRLDDELKQTETEIATKDGEKETLLSRKIVVDQAILTLNPANIKNELKAIEAKGKGLNIKKTEISEEVDKISGVSYDELLYSELNTEKNTLLATNMQLESEIIRLNKLVKDLKEGEICPTCKRALDNVDHSQDIKKNEELAATHRITITENTTSIGNITKQIEEIDKIKVIIDKKNKLELELSKIEVDLGSLKNDYREKKLDLKGYENNMTAITNNQNIDSEVTKISTELLVLNNTKTTKITEIERNNNIVSNSKTKIDENNKLIKTINKESEVEKIFKSYIEMVGKKGISKLVLRSVLPVINSELYNLLDGVCDFSIEMTMNSKNEVEFFLIKDDVYKTLKSGSGFERTASALALRCVLGKLSSLPKPNFIAFDEVLGKVSDENLDNIRLLFDRIKDMYDIVFLITHNHIVNDWADNIISVVKKNNISTITTK